MNLNDKYKKLYKDDYDELLIKMATATYVDHLGECIEQKRKELMTLPEYAIPTESLTKFQKDFTTIQKKNKQHTFMTSIYKTPRKVAVFIGVILVGLGLSVTTVDAFKIQLINFLIQTTDTYTNITLNEHSDLHAPKLPSDWDGHYYPHTIPEGFEITKASIHNNTGEIIYKDELGHIILYSMNANAQDLFVDTEGTTIKELMIHTYPAQLLTKDDLHTIAFNNGSSVFILSGNIAEDELINIAENIKK